MTEDPLAQRRNRPGIYRLGTITDDGHTITVTGWGLTHCANRCPCHLDGNGRLDIAEDHDGALGLVSHRNCRCCQAWTVSELVAVLRDVSDARALVAG